jgi:hypothetical protein
MGTPGSPTLLNLSHPKEFPVAKRIILFLLQFLAFGGLLEIGGNWDIVRLAQQMRAMQSGATAFNPIPVIKTQISATRILIADGLIFAGILFLMILLFEALRRKLKPWASITTLAFVLAVAVSLFLKIGLPPA